MSKQGKSRDAWKIFFLIVLMSAGCLGCGFNPGKPPTRWLGEYECRQGKTDLELTMEEVSDGNLRGIFHFQHVPSGAKGRFYLNGDYSPEDRTLTFVPGEWIERPPGYMTVGMDGVVLEDPMRYEGRITTQGCGNFRVDLVKQEN